MSFYILPMAGTGALADPFRPKYSLGATWQWVPTPREWGIAWADSTPAEQAALALNADVIVVPALDNTIALTATKNALEALNVPAQWLTAGMTYRTVLRVLVGIASYIQRCDGLGQVVTLAGNLDRTFSSLSAGVRNTLSAAADSLGLDRTGISGTTTLREALRIIGQQFAQRGVALGDL